MPSGLPGRAARPDQPRRPPGARSSRRATRLGQTRDVLREEAGPDPASGRTAARRASRSAMGVRRVRGDRGAAAPRRPDDEPARARRPGRSTTRAVVRRREGRDEVRAGPRRSSSGPGATAASRSVGSQRPDRAVRVASAPAWSPAPMPAPRGSGSASGPRSRGARRAAGPRRSRRGRACGSPRPRRLDGRLGQPAAQAAAAPRRHPPRSCRSSRPGR